jgi:hypothetical protein
MLSPLTPVFDICIRSDVCLSHYNPLLIAGNVPIRRVFCGFRNVELLLSEWPITYPYAQPPHLEALPAYYQLPSTHTVYQGHALYRRSLIHFFLPFFSLSTFSPRLFFFMCLYFIFLSILAVSFFIYLICFFSYISLILSCNIPRLRTPWLSIRVTTLTDLHISSSTLTLTLSHISIFNDGSALLVTRLAMHGLCFVHSSRVVNYPSPVIQRAPMHPSYTWFAHKEVTSVRYYAIDVIQVVHSYANHNSN